MTKKQLKFAHTYQINVCENKIKIKRIPHGDQSCGIFIKYSFLRNPSPRYVVFNHFRHTPKPQHSGINHHKCVAKFGKTPYFH